MKYKEYDRKDIYSILLSFWSTRVSILLSARTVFIAIETVIFSIGVYLASFPTSFWLRFFVWALGIVLACFWWWICTDFCFKQLYFRWRILQFEKGKYSSGEVWSDVVNFAKELKKNRKKKLSELSQDCEWNQIKPKWFPTELLNKRLPCLFMIFLTIVFIISISLQDM